MQTTVSRSLCAINIKKLLCFIACELELCCSTKAKRCNVSACIQVLQASYCIPKRIIYLSPVVTVALYYNEDEERRKPLKIPSWWIIFVSWINQARMRNCLRQCLEKKFGNEAVADVPSCVLFLTTNRAELWMQFSNVAAKVKVRAEQKALLNSIERAARDLNNSLMSGHDRLILHLRGLACCCIFYYREFDQLE